MKTNREKNTEHAARTTNKVRPKTPQYDFEALDAVMRTWASAVVTADEEVYSPYLGAV
jgi:hypothetical protein